jgi:reductive dehalogenase
MSEEKKQVSRRDFLKVAGLAAAAAQAGGLVAGGVAAGKDSESYTGWESFNPGTQSFNRKPFEYEYPAHEPAGEVRRPSHLTDYVFVRVQMFQMALQKNTEWQMGDPVADLGLPPPVVHFYEEYPERLEWDYKTFTETIPTHGEDMKVYGANYLLAQAYDSGFSMHGSTLYSPSAPPEEDDFTRPAAMMMMEPPGPKPVENPLPFKSPELATEFIKELAHRYGATLCRVTKTNPDFLYGDSWRGCPEDYDHSKMPAHWEYSIVIGVPMEWDVVLGSPQYSTSGDAYDRVSTAGTRLMYALKFMGYPARAHTPMTGYDLLAPPIAIDAGLGEVSRPGFCITPEVGSNLRLAVVTTNLPMKIDKPIKFGVAEFCNECKICAEQCPSGAISMADSPAEQEWGTGPVLRGYEHWYINNGACYNFWRESAGPLGCRLCVANCPYSRKDNWLHELAREVDPRDPTGLTRASLLLMQKNFFDHPTAEEYRRPPVGEFASYRPEPFYLDVERYLDVKVTKP